MGFKRTFAIVLVTALTVSIGNIGLHGKTGLEEDKNAAEPAVVVSAEDFQQYTTRRVLPGGTIQESEYSSICKFSADGTCLITGGGNCLRLWEIPSCRMAYEIIINETILGSPDFTPDGKHFLVLLKISRKDGTQEKFAPAIAHYETLTGKRLKLITLPDELPQLNSCLLVCGDGISIICSDHYRPMSKWYLPIPGRKPDNKRVNDLIRQLGDDSYDVREQADLELKKIGVTVLPALEKARNSSDPEIAWRAEELLKEIAKPTLIKVFPKHQTIYAAQTTPDRKFFVTQPYGDGTVDLYDMNTCDCLARINIEESVCNIAVSPDGKQIAVAPYQQQQCLLYRYDDSKKTYTRYYYASKRGTNTSRFLEFSSDGRHLFTFNHHGNSICAWELPWMKKVAELKIDVEGKSILNIVFSPRGDYLAIVDKSYCCKLYAIKGTKISPAKVPSFFQFNNRTAAFSSDGKLCAQVLTDEKTFMVRDTDSGETILKKDLNGGLVEYFLFSSDKKYLVAGTGNKGKQSYHVIDVATGKVLWTCSSEEEEEEEGICRALEVSHDGKFLFATRGELIQMRDIKSGETVKAFQIPADYARLSPDGTTLFCSNDSTALLLDVRSGKVIWKKCWEKDYIWRKILFSKAIFSHDGNSIACNAVLTTRCRTEYPLQINVLMLLDAKNGNLAGTFAMKDLKDICFFHNKLALLARERLVVWDPAQDKEIAKLPEYGGRMTAACVLEGMKRILVAQENGSVWVWEKPEKNDKAAEDKE